MATIRRHPVPIESYAPDRPLNDLLIEQLKHFIHVEERLDPKLRVTVPIPSLDDVAEANRFTAAVTERLMSIKRSPPFRLVKNRTPKRSSSSIALAAQAATAKSSRSTQKKNQSSKPKPRGGSK
jgi:hypothetical protein